MTPGPELDAAVAKAIGWVFQDSQWLAPLPFEGLLDGFSARPEMPPYSTDANAALEAAETVFTEFDLCREGRYYFVSAMKPCKDEPDMVEGFDGKKAKTPAHALCLAILKAKEKQ